MPDFSDRDQERLDVLAGVRTNVVKGKAAVRREDLAAFSGLTRQTSARITSGSTVSVAQYNAVVADLAALWQAITQIAASIK